LRKLCRRLLFGRGCNQLQCLCSGHLSGKCRTVGLQQLRSGHVFVDQGRDKCIILLELRYGHLLCCCCLHFLLQLRCWNVFNHGWLDGSKRVHQLSCGQVLGCGCNGLLQLHSGYLPGQCYLFKLLELCCGQVYGVQCNHLHQLRGGNLPTKHVRYCIHPMHQLPRWQVLGCYWRFRLRGVRRGPLRTFVVVIGVHRSLVPILRSPAPPRRRHARLVQQVLTR